MGTGKKVLLCIIIILALLVVGVGGFFLGKNYSKSDNNTAGKETKQEEKKEETKKEEFKYEDYSGLPYSLCGFPGITIEEKNVYLKDLTAEEKMNIVIALVNKTASYDDDAEKYDDKGGVLVGTFTEEDAKEFFEDTSFIGSKKNNEYDVMYPYNVYKVDDKLDIVEYAGGCTGDGSGEYVIQKDKKIEDGKAIYTFVYYNLSVEYPDDSNDPKISIYSDIAGKKLVASDIDGFDKISDYYDKLNTYEVYYDITDNNMRFEKMIFNKK